MKSDFMFTSEAVTAGHPDKLCDQISDAIVDRVLRRDPTSRVIAETAISSSVVFVSAMFDSTEVIDYTNIAREVIEQVGYTDTGFNAKTCSIITSLKEMPRAPEFDFDERGLSDAKIESVLTKELATVFGYACDQTDAMMPLPIWLARRLAMQLSQAGLDGSLDYLAPDGKTQVGIEYRNGRAYRIHSITIITGLKDERRDLTRLEEDIRELVINPVFTEEPIRPDKGTRLLIQPYEPFRIGGPSVHAGLTGRKNGIDTYGEFAREGQAALSGKDPSRIDRIGTYAARYAAKNIVASGLAKECEIQLSYAFEFSRPVSIQVETFGTGTVPDEQIAEVVRRHFEFRPAGIMKQFDLRRLPSQNLDGFYQKLAAFGHVGRSDLQLPWEATDKVDLLRAEIKQGR